VDPAAVPSSPMLAQRGDFALAVLGLLLIVLGALVD
jgi:hypothetical protein